MLETDATRQSSEALDGADAPRASEGSEVRISANFASFDESAARANDFFAKGDRESAAVWAAIASHVATRAHCGIFSSPRLEHLLNRIGRELPDRESAGSASTRGAHYKKILHVCTEAHESGGLTRMLCRWTNADRSRTYSLALTQHRGAIPGPVLDAISQSGGQIYSINKTAGGCCAGRRSFGVSRAITMQSFCTFIAKT